MTGQEIIEKLKEAGISTEEIAWCSDTHVFVEVEGLGSCIEVEQFGGEGQGDTWYSVKHFPDHDVYLKINGYYQSHYGTDIYGWDQVQVVAPQVKTITVYE